MKKDSINRVEIIGCTASGKTTLCKTMQKLGWTPIYEPYETNPFLTDFFAGEKCAFELQMCFLLQHFNRINSTNHPTKNLICDFSFFLDSIYASILLSNKEMTIYTELLSYIISKISPPKYVIKLTCPNDIIFDRIRNRNRTFEQAIDKEFVEALNQKVNNYTTDCKLIQVDSSQINLLNEIDVYNKIVKKLV